MFLLALGALALKDDSSLKSLNEVPSVATVDSGECASMRDSLPALCKMFGEEQCETMRTKITDNCPEEAEESDEELIEDDETPVDDEDDSTDVGESSGAGVGRRGASLMTMGSFTMMSTNA